jgi:hypothetical protein
MNTSLSIFARALASENISFSFDNKAETAAFDVENRHLMMPVWNVSETVQTMLVAHEISHALWTPYEQSKSLFDQAEKDGYVLPLLQRIANVIEDVRIEKKMKDKFPGTRRDFFIGYKEIYDLDMFKIKGADLSSQLLISRINIHFKWGVPGFVTVPFDSDEAQIVDAVDACESFDQVFALAKAIYDSPAMDEVRQRAMQQQDGDGPAQQRQGDGPEIPEMIDTNMAGIAEKKGSRALSPTVVIPMLENINDAIITTDQILALFERRDEQYQMPALPMDEYRKFVRESDAFVRQLVAQFERKKAADEIRRERPKQTGQLNLDRLHQYRTHDDIFLSKIIKQDGKNHGIVFLLDLSGSMAQTIGNCFLQVLQLTWFCEKAKIPFEVFGFTDMDCDLMPEEQEEFKAWMKQNPMGSYHDFKLKVKRMKIVGSDKDALMHGYARLFTIASSRDSAEKRERLLAHYHAAVVTGSRSLPFSMNGTPTVEAVAFASQFIKDWVSVNNIQIPTLMVVTDGQPNGVYRYNTNDEEQNLYHIGEKGSMTVVNKITETIDRIQFREMTSGVPNECIGLMLNSLRTKFNARIVGMYVSNTALSESIFYHFCMSSKERQKASTSTVTNSPRFKAAKEAYADGCIVLHPETYPGFDSFFLVKTPKPVADSDAIADGGTFTRVKNQFIKTMSKRAGSRVFLARYIDIVAGQPLRKGADALYSLAVR